MHASSGLVWLMGDEPARLLGALLVSAFSQAAKARADTLEKERRDFMLYTLAPLAADLRAFLRMRWSARTKGEAAARASRRHRPVETLIWIVHTVRHRLAYGRGRVVHRDQNASFQWRPVGERSSSTKPLTLHNFLTADCCTSLHLPEWRRSFGTCPQR
jgi:hypothetical protein